jgi:hypothetical protein
LEPSVGAEQARRVRPRQSPRVVGNVATCAFCILPLPPHSPAALLALESRPAAQVLPGAATPVWIPPTTCVSQQPQHPTLLRLAGGACLLPAFPAGTVRRNRGRTIPRRLALSRVRESRKHMCTERRRHLALLRKFAARARQVCYKYCALLCVAQRGASSPKQQQTTQRKFRSYRSPIAGRR